MGRFIVVLVFSLVCVGLFESHVWHFGSVGTLCCIAIGMFFTYKLVK